MASSWTNHIAFCPPTYITAPKKKYQYKLWRVELENFPGVLFSTSLFPLSTSPLRGFVSPSFLSVNVYIISLRNREVRSLRNCGATTAGCLETGPRIPSLLPWNPSYTVLSPYNPLVQPTCIFDVSIQFIPTSLPNPYQPINRLVHLVLHSTIFVGTTHRFELMIGDEHV